MTTKVLAIDDSRTMRSMVRRAMDTAALKARARVAGATGWIVKPFDDQALIQVVRRVTGAQ